MGRKTILKNPKRVEAIKELCKREKLTQTQLAALLEMPQQSLSRIMRNEAVSEDLAYRISEKFPQYSLEWFLGIDNNPTLKDQLSTLTMELQNESELLETATFSFFKLLGYEINVNHPDTGSFVKKIHTGYTITKGTKEIVLNLKDFNSFANKICDYVDFELQHMK